jgi:hydrogenase maturation protein HypF
VSAEAEAVLTAPARPIVLLPRRAEQLVVDVVAPRNPHLGILLPYAPLHHLLFAPVPQHDAPVPRVLVMTSGNISDEPLCYDDDDARRRLNELADAFLIHDRPIHVPCDDSVVKLVDDRVLPIRRSRGYAPVPISLPVESPPMIAVGGELKNVFCVSRGTDAWLSQHLGDMGSLETLVAFDRSVRQLQLLYDAVPGEVAADRHPAYHTTAWAERAAIGPITTVQHHHAHLASLLAEHGQPIEAAVIGVIFDGTGYGEDGTIWGGEFLVGGYKSVERLAHLASVPLPGGDMTIQRPYRAALAYLHAAGLPWDSDLAPTQACAAGELDVLARQLESGFQCIPSSSMGRLFDVVASLLGVRQTVSFEAQAAIELEELARRGDSGAAQYSLRWNGSTLETGPLLEAIVADVRAGTDTCAIAAGFHRAVVDAAATVVEDIAERRGVRIVGLSGGVFQNAVLLSQLRDRLMDRGLQVLTHSLVPPNDGGLALGQAAVAAARRHRVESTDDRSR